MERGLPVYNKDDYLDRPMICTAKQKWKNLYRSYRTALSTCTEKEALAWIGFWSKDSRVLLEKVLQSKDGE